MNELVPPTPSFDMLRPSPANSLFLKEGGDNYFRQVIDHSPTILWITNADMKCTYLSLRWYEFTGRDVPQDLGLTWLENIHPDDIERARGVSRAARAVQEAFTVDFRLRHSDGTYRWVESVARPIREGDEFRGYIGTVMDIHRRKEVELALKTAKEQAESASQLKNTFLANMSHEIRTPMTAVLGFAEVLHDPTLSEPERFRSIRRIEQSGRNLLRLIDDILDISKIEAGRLQIERVPFSPIEVIKEVISMLQMQAEAKGLEITLGFENELPGVFVSDPTRLRQILTNLIGNAIKFTHRGGIRVTAAACELSRDECLLVFEVRDTGIGIPADKQARLFQPFAQADESITRKFGGSGLGLLLSKRLAEHLGGYLELKSSVPGEGSCFHFEIAGCIGCVDDAVVDLSVISEPWRAATPVRSLAGARILIAEDVAENQLLFQIYLEGAGAIVDTAANGEQALRQIEKNNYDVILMDVQMPVLDGLEATRRLRDRGYAKPILALTAHAMSEERELSQNAGCNDHLTKPITRYQLVESIKKYLPVH